MTIQTQWYNDETRIIHQIYFSNWTIEEFLQAIDTARNMSRSQAHSIHIIICFSGAINLPRDFLYTLRHIDSSEPIVSGFTIIVGGGAFIRSLLGIVERILPCHAGSVRLTDTIDDALAFIAESEHEMIGV